MDDSKRRASDAIIEALEDNFTMIEIIELAMDDITASEEVERKLADIHDLVTDSRRL